MSAWFLALDGTDTGHHLALGLALFAAVLHAIFGALQKGRHDPWLTRGAIDFCYGAMALPIAFFLVPFPEPHMWIIFAWVFVVHIVYKLLQAMAYSKGAYTVVYPVVRGTGPLVTVLVAGILFSEDYSLEQWGGVLLLSGGIFALAAVNLYSAKTDRDALQKALMFAFGTGILVAVYTTSDAYGIRATANPFTFLAWFFLIDGLVFPVIAFMRWNRLAKPPDIGPLMARGFIGAIVAFLSFGSIMLATRLDKVGEAAVMRETSVVFAALIGAVFLKEKVGVLRGALMAVIALGAVVVEFG